VRLIEGGAIAAKFASVYPNKIKKLVFIAPAGFPINPPKETFLTYIPVVGELVMVYTKLAQEKMLRNLGNKFIDTKKNAHLVKLIHDKMKLNYEHNPSFSIALLQTVRDFPMGGLQNAFEEVGKHDYPVQVIWGDKDHLCPYENSKLLLQAIPRAELVTIEGLEHFFVFESEDKIIDAMLQFFEKN
jgi:pimeloyl-ACP methyl ester carboxylesterase